MMTNDEQERLWNDPGNWNADGSYRCAADRRLLVKNQLGFGWTLNMAHPRARGFMLGVVLLALGFVTVVGIVAIRV
jgi:uncharacterized membrane protein